MSQNNKIICSLLVLNFFLVRTAQVPQLPGDIKGEVVSRLAASSTTIPELRENIANFIRASEKKDKEANVQLAKKIFEQRKKEILEEIQKKYDEWAVYLKDENKYNIVQDGVNARLKKGEYKGEPIIYNILLTMHKKDAGFGRFGGYITGAPNVDNTSQGYEVMKLLVENGANVNMGQGSDTPLDAAVVEDNLSVVQLLVEHGAEINCRDNKGYTPLRVAFMQPNVEIAEYLLNRGANPFIKDKKGKAVFQYIIDKQLNENEEAIGHEREEIYIQWVTDIKKIEPLLDAKMAEWKTLQGKYSVSSSIYSPDCRFDILQGVNQQSGVTGNTPLMCVIQHMGQRVAQDTWFYKGVTDKNQWAKSYDLITGLLNLGADVNKANKQGLTALMIAAQRGIVPVVELLLQHGVKINAQDEHGRTALRFAAGTLPQITSLLLEHGADMRSDNYNQTPLSVAQRLKEVAQTADEKANIEQVIQRLENKAKQSKI